MLKAVPTITAADDACERVVQFSEAEPLSERVVGHRTCDGATQESRSERGNRRKLARVGVFRRLGMLVERSEKTRG
jgi:hypothetical protein